MDGRVFGRVLLYVFGVFDESYSAHDVVTIFDPEYFSYFFGYCYPSACDYFCEEGNVFFLDLDRHYCSRGKWLRTR